MDSSRVERCLRIPKRRRRQNCGAEQREGEFQNLAKPKDEDTIRNLRDPELERIIGFLNPIFHPEKA